MIEKLTQLIGNTYLYENVKIEIQKVKKVSATYVVITDKRAYNMYESEANDFIKNLKQLNTFKNMSAEITEVPKEDKITQIIFDAIAKVKNDKEYIQQANAISNLTTQLINIKKLELQMLSKKKS